MTSLAQALAAQEAGADAVVGKGLEAGGWVGEEGAFVLLQRLVGSLDDSGLLPGRDRRHTVAAAYVGGAAGAVLDGQLLLTRESPLAAEARSRWREWTARRPCWSEIGTATRSGSTAVPAAPASQQLAEAADGADSVARWRAAARDVITDAATADGLPPLGQDAALAADLGARSKP